jgi:hypothetical protein
MDYKAAWEHLKDWVRDALDEGKERGFDKPSAPNKLENGMFEAYDNVKNEMMYIESHQN